MWYYISSRDFSYDGFSRNRDLATAIVSQANRNSRRSRLQYCVSMNRSHEFIFPIRIWLHYNIYSLRMLVTSCQSRNMDCLKRSYGYGFSQSNMTFDFVQVKFWFFESNILFKYDRKLAVFHAIDNLANSSWVVDFMASLICKVPN